MYESRYQEEDFWERNPDLRPEEVRTLELAWEQRIAAGLFGTVSLYDYRADDLIDQVFDEEDIGSFANLGAVDARGFEAALTARLENGAVASLGYTWQHARDVADGGELTNSPEHLVRGRIGVPLGSWLFGAATVSYEDRRLTVYETVTDAHILANLTVTARAFGDRLEETHILHDQIHREVDISTAV